MADAGGIRAGRAYVELGANDGPLKAALDRAAARLQAYGASIRGIGAKLASAGGAGLAGIGAAVSSFVAVGADLQRMSERTGLSVEALSQFGYAMEQSGSNLAAFEAGVQSLQGKLVAAAQGGKEAQDAFLGLGLSWRDLAPLNAAQQVEVLAQQISQIEHPARRAQAALQVFGSTDILPFLAGGAAGIRAMREEADRLGVTMSGETAQSAAQLAQAFAAMKSSLQAVAVAIGAAIGPELAGLTRSMLPLVKATTDWVKENKPLVVSIAAGAAAVAVLGTGLVTVGTVLGALGSAVGVVATLGAALLPVVAIAAGVVVAVEAVAAAAYAAARAVNFLAGAKVPKRESSGNAAQDAGLHVWDTIAVAAEVSWGRVTKSAGDAWARMRPLLATVGRGVKAVSDALADTKAGRMIEAAMAPLKAGATALKDVLLSPWDLMKTRASAAWSALSDGWQSVKGTATLAVDGIGAAIRNGRWDVAFKIGTTAIQLEWAKLTSVMQARWDGFRDSFDDAVDSIQDKFDGGLAELRGAWVRVTSFLVGDWDGFTKTLSAYWDVSVKMLEGMWDGFKSTFTSVVADLTAGWNDFKKAIEAAVAPIQKVGAELEALRSKLPGPKILGAGALLGSGPLPTQVAQNLGEGKGVLGLGDKEGNDAQKQQRLDEIKAARDKAEADRKAAQDQRAQERAAAEAERKQRVEKLEKEFNALLGQAQQARDPLTTDQRQRGNGALGGVQKADVVGSFGGSGAFGFGGKTVVDRMAGDMGNLAQTAREMLQELKNPKRAPVVGDF